MRTNRSDLAEICRQEGPMLRGHIAVSLVGFSLDAILLHASLAAGLAAPAARLISLFWAMQVTFALNGLMVFRSLQRVELPRQWISYMGCNGAGNLANYVIFVALVASRAPVLSQHFVALAIGGLTAWTINYCGARWLAFRSRSKASLPREKSTMAGFQATPDG